MKGFELTAIVALLLFINISHLFGQQQVSKKLVVVDGNTNEPIENVSVFSAANFKAVLTNEYGVADLSKFSDTDVLNFQHPAYDMVTLTYAQLIAQNYQVTLEEKVIRIGEVVVSANKWEQDRQEIPNEILAITPKQVTFRNPQTAADILESSGQVFVQKSQLGGGSPMIRGFAANRILLVVDGVRMNNAIFRSGNLQNVIVIDPNMLNSTEVIFGPGSVIYGSDALGGVVDFHTIRPKLAIEKNFDVGGSAFTRYASANNEITGHLDLNLGWKKFASLTSFTVSRFDHLKTGNNRTDKFPDFGKRPWFVENIDGEDVVIPNEDENLQIFSGYKQYNLLQKFRFRPNDYLDLDLNIYYTTTSDIPRYDRLIEERNNQPRSAQWFYGPQRLLMNVLSASYYKANKAFDQGKLTFSYQDYQESRHDRIFGDAGLRSRTENLDIFTFNLDFDRKFDNDHQLFYGLEGVYNKVASQAQEADIFTEFVSPASTRYPDGGSDYSSFAFYGSYKWNINKQWILNAGARYNFVGLRPQFNDTTFYNFPFDEIELKNSALNGTLGVVFLPNETWKIDALFSSGFRAPNVDDVGKVFDSEPGTVVVPNPDLGPEYAYNFEIGVTKTLFDKIRLELVGYYTLLEDAMVRRDFTFNGQDSILYDGRMSNVQALVNVGKAYIYGFSANLKAEIVKDLTLTSSLSYSDGRDKTDDIPLRHTTPLFGQTALLWDRGKFSTELYFKYNGKREFEDLPPSEQNKTHLYTPDGSLAWYTMNLRASYRFNEHLVVNGAVENILNKHYRPYSSGISAPGINAIISLRANI